MSASLLFSLAVVGSLGLFQAPSVYAEDVAVFSLGNRRPEGIHVPPPEASEIMGFGEGTFALVSDLFFGSVRAVNTASGDITEIVPPRNFNERLAVGMWYSEGAIFVCGGGPFLDPSLTAIVHVYNATTGEDIVSCSPVGGGGLLNDVVVKDGFAYVTDSGLNSIMTLDVAAAIGGECVVSSIETPLEYFGFEGINANGIIDYEDGLIIANYVNSSLFFLNLTTETVSPMLSPGSSTPFADGLARAGNTLYVAENEMNRISVWNLASDNGMVTVELEGYLLSDSYDIPATCDVQGDVVYAVNARFSSLPFPAENEFNLTVFNETFDLVGVNRNVITSPEDLPMNPIEDGGEGMPVESSMDSSARGEGAVAVGYYLFMLVSLSMTVASLA